MEYLYKNIESLVSSCISKTTNYISSCISKTTNYISTQSFMSYNAWIIYIIYGFSKTQIIIETTIKSYNNYIKMHLIKYKPVQNCSILFTQIYGVIIKNYRGLYSFFYKHRIEPLEPEWIDLSEMSVLETAKINSSLYKYEEKYTFIQDQLLDIDKSNLFNIKYLELTTNQFIKDNTCSDKLIIAKLDNKYLYRVIINNKLTESNSLYNIIPSKTRFLSILYIHPKQENTIYIDISAEHFLLGNEILSACFILRYLEYQAMSYIFDLDYKLNIIDNYVNQFTLKSNQYIVLLENKYIIHEIS